MLLAVSITWLALTAPWTLRAFVMMWCHLSPEWFEAEPNPNNAAIRLIDEGTDRGYVFEGFPRT